MRRRESPKNLLPRNFLFSRPELLKSFPLLAAACSFKPSLFASSARLQPRLPVFELIPPSASGRKWVHTAGKSSEKYLPETSGAGCAFFHYDNDGWMDIYLV